MWSLSPYSHGIFAGVRVSVGAPTSSMSVRVLFWGVSYVFVCALALLPCDGRVWHSPHHCTVYRSDRVVVLALVHESAFPCPVPPPPPNVYVTWSGLVHSLRDPPVVLAQERDLAWLEVPPRLWCERLLDVSPPDWGLPGPWVALPLATALSGVAP